MDTYEIPSGEDDCKTKINEISEMKEKVVELQMNKNFLPKNIMVFSEDLSSDDVDSIRKYIKTLRYNIFLKKSTIRRLNHTKSYKLLTYTIKLDIRIFKQFTIRWQFVEEHYK